MPLGDVAKISVSTTGSPVTRVGFGTPLILGVCAAWGASSDRVRTYRKLADLVADGFVSSDPEYKAAAALLAQTNPPPSFKLGRRALLPTQQWVIIPTAQNLHKYRVTIDGQNADFTADGTSTVAEACTGIKAAIDALSLAVTTTNEGPGTDVKVVANAAGAWHSLKACLSDNAQKPDPYLDIKENQADPGIATDLDAILAADADWYALILTYHSKAEIVAAAAWVESNGPRLFFPSSNDSGNYGAVTTDTAYTVKAANDARTPVLYHHDVAQFPEAAWCGSRLPTDPGSENWAFAPGAGVEATVLTATQQANLDGKRCNYFYEVNGKDYFWPGKVADNEWIDVIRFRDWLQVTMGEDILQLQMDLAAQGKKVPFDDGGIAAVQASILATLKQGVRQGGLAASPAPTCTVPRAADLSSSDRSSRNLSGVSFTGDLAGAINLTTVTGVLS